MPATHVVVDGSNIATEGRSSPSLGQLDDAVRQFQEEFPEAETVVVVDATFGHRIDPSERKAFDDAVSHGELVSPPAGAIGRGDAFVLRIAERVSAQVLSNDSFQEFHAEHPWLFDEGRLMGGKPVPGVGWIFTPRRPVRGPRSRTGRADADGHAAGDGASRPGTARPRRRGRSAAVLEAVEAAAAAATEAAASPAPTLSGAEEQAARRRPRRARRGGRRRPPTGDPTVVAAIEAAKEEAIGTGDMPSGKPARAADVAGATGGPQAVNDPLTFVRFITAHPLGDEVEGVVSVFVSHGAMVEVGDMHCYVPLSGLGVPPPKSARAVLKKEQRRRFVVVCLDPPRRGAQLALAELRDELGLDLPRPSRRRAVQTPVKASKPAEAKRASKPAKAAKTSKAAKAAKASKAAKARQAPKAGKAGKAGKAAKASKPGRVAKTPKIASATKPAKPATTTSGRSRHAVPRDNFPKTSGASTSQARSSTEKATKGRSASNPDRAGKRSTPTANERQRKTKAANTAKTSRSKPKKQSPSSTS